MTSEVPRRFARLPKQIVNDPGPFVHWPAPKLRAFFSLLDDSQCLTDPIVPIDSEYEFMNLLGIARPSGKEYRMLRTFLKEISDEDAYCVNKWYARTEFDGSPRYTRVTFPYLWKIRHHLDGRSRSICFNRKFYRRAMKFKRSWVPVYLDEIHRLRCTHYIWLMLIVQAFLDKPNRHIKRDINGLALKIGMRDENTSRLKTRLKAATEAVADVLGWDLETECDGDFITIRRERTAQEEASDDMLVKKIAELNEKAERLLPPKSQLRAIADNWHGYDRYQKNEIQEEISRPEWQQIKQFWRLKKERKNLLKMKHEPLGQTRVKSYQGTGKVVSGHG